MNPLKQLPVIALVIVLALSMALVGCGSDAADQEPAEAVQESELAPEPTEKSIEAVAEALGLTDRSDVYFEIIGAQDGAEFNGGSVELYLFDEGSDAYETMISGEGFTVPAAYKDGVVLVFPEGTDPDPALVEAFDGLVF